MKKHSDGYYYEKIVSYKHKPNYGFRILSIILFTIFILVIIWVVKSEGMDVPQLIADNLIGVVDAIMMAIGFIVVFGGSIIGGVFLLIHSSGEGRKVKYRRIGR